MKFSMHIIEEPLDPEAETEPYREPSRWNVLLMGALLVVLCSAFWALAVYGADTLIRRWLGQ